MNKLIFEDRSKFILIDYGSSHSELLFRSYQNDERDYNLDLIFKGVTSVNIVTKYKGLKVYLKEKTFGQISQIVTTDLLIFQLSSLDVSDTYIECSAMGLFKNRLEFPNSSLGDFMWTSKNECLLWLTNSP